MNCCKKTLLLLASVVVFIFASIAGFGQTAASTGNISNGPRIWLQENQPLPVQHIAVELSNGHGMVAVDGSVLTGLSQAQPLSMASADLDQDGFNDLVVGYSGRSGGFISIQRGNMDAFAPQSDASFKAIGRGQFPSPFHLEAKTFSVPVRPDFIALGNFLGDGNKDLAVAAKGGNTLYIFPGDGKGNFGNPQTVNLADGVTALAAGELGGSHTPTLIIGGLRSLTVYVSTSQGLTVAGGYKTGGAVSNILFGDFGDAGPDVAFLTSGKVQILRSSTMGVTTVSLPVSVRAFALGSFIYDRNGAAQIALVAPDGSVQIAVRSGFDPRPYSSAELALIRQAAPRGRSNPLLPGKSFPVNGWKIVESFPGVASLGTGQTPVFFQTRISNHGADDVMLLNPFAGQLVVIAHPNLPTGATTFLPGQVSLRPYSGTPVAAQAMRINVDGRPGVMALHQGELAPSMIMPIPDPTFFVNTFNDPTPTSPIANACNNTSFADTSSSCSLREAVLKANGDTIMLQAGTYTLTLPRVAGDNSGQTGALYVNNTATIVGAVDGSGNPTSIIQAGTTSSNGVDLVMAVNEDITSFTDATASLSNLVIQFGHNNGSFAVGDGFAGGIEFDTGGAATATLTLTNVTVANNSTTDGDGGGLAIFNTNDGSGAATITASIIQNNTPQESSTGGSGLGGGIYVGQPGSVILSNTQVINNNATQANTPMGQGGGLYLTGEPSTPQTSAVHGGSISGNTAAGEGGGIYSTQGMTIDTGTVISNNTSGVAGGGVWYNATSPFTATLNKITITGNSVTGVSPDGVGGGIRVESAANAFTMSFSRLAGNSASTAGGNLSEDSGTVTAANNWWGTNAPAGTIDSIGGSSTFDPFIVLTHTASPNNIQINQSSTLTGDMSKDNHGNGAALAGNLDVLNGLPITFHNAVLGTIAEAQPEALNSNAQATATFNAGGTGGNGSADATVDQQTVTANISVVVPQTTTKVFTPAGIQPNGTSTMTITITNPAGNTVALTNLSFTDNFPANLVVATPNGLTNTCGGTATATAGSGTVSLTGGTVAANTSCTVSATVTSAATGIYLNDTGPVTSDNGGTGADATATLSVAFAPTISKLFLPDTINQNQTTLLSFTINNPNSFSNFPNSDVTLTGIAFTDNLPTGLVIATPNNLSNSCDGTVTADPGSSVITLTGGDLGPAVGLARIKPQHPLLSLQGLPSSQPLQPLHPKTTVGGASKSTLPQSKVIVRGGSPQPDQPSSSGSCFISVEVQATVSVPVNTSVTLNNTTGPISANESGAGATSNTATLTVSGVPPVQPPTIAKAFGGSTVPLNGTTTLTLTFGNPNSSTTLNNVSVDDPLPSGLIASPNGVTGSCFADGGFVVVNGSGTDIQAVGSSLSPNTSCSFTINVTGTTSGLKNNTTGNVGADYNSGSETVHTTGGSASASIIVVLPPSIAKAFNPNSIPVNTTTQLGFTITNPSANPVALTGVGFTDVLPASLTVANASSSVCGGTLTTSGGNTITLSGATIAVNSTCAFSVTVTGTQAGSFVNTTGAVTSNEGGTGNTATSNLTVAAPPSITKAFGAPTIPLNGTTSLTFTIQNPNTGVTLTGIAFIDSLPAGLVVATPSYLHNTCGGTAAATAGSGSVSLSGGTLASSASCMVSVNIQGTTAGVKNNSVTVSSTEGGTGNTSTGSITVVAPPTIMKAFGAAHIPLSGTTSLSFTIQNGNSVGLTGIGFSDTLPSGLVVSTPNGLTGSCGSGTITATQNTGVISLSGGSLAANTSCTFSVNVTGTSAGTKNNTTSAVTSNEGGTGGTASSSIIVVAPPSISKAFSPSSIALSQTTSLGFTITNPSPNPIALTGVGFTDVLQTGLTVANGSSAVCGGTLTTSGGNTISVSGATIAANSSCNFSVTVTPTAFGNYTNTTSNVTSNEGGTGNAAVASLTVFPVVISPGSVNFGDVDSDQSATTTVTISNNGNAAVSLSISLTPGTGTSANNFTFSTNCPSSLAAHHSCTVTITFTAPHVTSASQLGVSTATLNVVSAGFTQHVPLSANVIDPEPQFTPGSLSFGHVTVNHSSTQALTLKNVGLTALNITGFTVTGNQPADFTFQNLCPASLSPGNSCTINVTFTPKATGNRDAKLNLIANDEAEFVPISGIGQ